MRYRGLLLSLVLLGIEVPATAAEPLQPDTEPPYVVFLESRLQRDPLDFLSRNRLAAWLLDRFAESNDHADLVRAKHHAQASLEAFPPKHNPYGLLQLTRANVADHEFAQAGQQAQLLIKLLPEHHAPNLLLGDALLETGDYRGAADAYESLAQREVMGAGPAMALAARRSRLAWLHGDLGAADALLQEALAHARERKGEATGRLRANADSNVAWCLWQIGVVAFHRGDLRASESAQLAALDHRPGYARAIAALAGVRAAQGELAAAITLYEEAVTQIEKPAWLAALAALYARVGDVRRARALHARIEDVQVESLTNAATAGQSAVAVHTHDGRALALFYADHGLRPALALRLAQAEYARRQDIYSADAVAWTALNAGQLELAASTMTQALRLGTPDATLYYHAAQIAQARGEAVLARAHVERALQLNPYFDPVQAPIAEELRARLAPERND